MPTFLFGEIIFGPVRSRRLGLSLGINLLPLKRKVCNFNCVYCECGWTGDSAGFQDKLPSRKDVYDALEVKLFGMKSRNTAPDVITYAGNGEPTLHPDFPGIIDDSLELRNRYFPEAKIAVLSNASTAGNPVIRAALLNADMNIQKFDSAFESTIKYHNQPLVRIQPVELIENLASFNGKVIIQSLFLRGIANGHNIDNTTPEEIAAWLKAIEKIKPSEVMIYTISRDIPIGADLSKVPAAELREIAESVGRMGIRTRVSA